MFKLSPQCLYQLTPPAMHIRFCKSLLSLDVVQLLNSDSPMGEHSILLALDVHFPDH